MTHNQIVRTRIAPAPTGPFHIGNARTALYNYLLAKHNGGQFVLRIEDTDMARSDQKYEQEIFDSLKWLGIQPDEGPVQGGSYGPYRQSERTAAYRRELERLIDSGQAYYCPHSDAELAAEKQGQLAAKQPPVHRCEWRERGVGEGKPLDTARGKGIIRFKTPADRVITFIDLIRGAISFESNLLGDFSIAKDLSSPLYNFAVVIDDQAMNISHVIRGEDHISNTPKQILMQHALEWHPPAYAHLPLILGPDRTKLSSRHGATSIRELGQAGYLAEAIVNFMALLGWNPGGEREIFSMEELIQEFDLGKVQKSGAIFNIEKLDWMNGEYIRRKQIGELIPLARPYLPDFSESDTMDALRLEQPRLKKLSELAGRVEYLKTAPDYPAALLGWKQMSADDITASLQRSERLVADTPESEFTAPKLQERFFNAIGIGDRGTLLWPLRVAITGKEASPGPFEIMAILGKSKTLERLRLARRKIS